MQNKAGAIVIAPSWERSGSYRVFQGQIKTLRELGFETYFFASPHFWTTADYYERYVQAYRENTPDIGADHRGEASFTGVTRQAILRFDKSGDTRTEAYRATKSANLLRIPKSMIRFAKSKELLFILCNHFFNVPYMRQLQNTLRRPLKFAVETHDIQSRRYRSADGEMDDIGYELTFADELAELGEAEHLVHLSAEECAVFADRLPDSRHHLIFPALPKQEPVEDATSRTTFLIVASSNQENADGLAWFFDNVWVRYQGGGTLAVVGSVDSLMKERHPDVYSRWQAHFIGSVADLRGWYDSAAVVLLPTISGEGIAIKFAEAMAFGKRVFFLPRATRGLPEEIVATMKDGRCENAGTMLEKMHSVSIPAPIVVSHNALAVYNTLFSEGQHARSYREIASVCLNERPRHRFFPTWR